MTTTTTTTSWQSKNTPPRNRPPANFLDRKDQMGTTKTLGRSLHWVCRPEKLKGKTLQKAENTVSETTQSSFKAKVPGKFRTRYAHC
jgi:hypothetical protein